MRGQDVSAQAQYVANMPHTRKSRIPVEHLPLGARSRRIESGVCGWIYLVGGPVSPAIRGSAAYVVIWRGLCGGGLPALALGRCSCHQQGGEFGVRDTASEQTLGAS